MSKRKWIILLAIFLLPLAEASKAHVMAPVLITLTQIEENQYQASWSFSRDVGAVDPTSASLALTPNCEIITTAILTESDDRWLREELYSCANEDNTQISLSVEGLQFVDISVAVRLIDEEQNEQIHLLHQGSRTLTLSNKGNAQSPFLQYLILGFEHILEGADHLLFVIALCFLAGGAVRSLIVLITAFTVAHSITLSAAVMGWVSLPGRPVEALIALSIALVAVDLMKKSVIPFKRMIDYWPIIFIFGLLHGLGFAGALLDLGLPQSSMLTALLAFNLGVEMGQLVMILACAVFIYIVHKFKSPGWLNPSVGMGIGCTAGYWFVSRVV